MEQTVNNRPLGRAKMEVKDLNLFYGDFQALKHVSISMPEKEITAFIGPSGCGKSTLLKTLNRMTWWRAAALRGRCSWMGRTFTGASM